MLGAMNAFGLRRPSPAAPAEWFSKTYGARLGMRSITFREAIERLCDTTGPERTIVETGCVRERNDYSAGYSTVVFAELAERYGGRIFTVDSSAPNMSLCRRVTRRWSKLVSYNVGDSIAYLRAWADGEGAGRRIDLLYLDSWDYPIAPGRSPSSISTTLWGPRKGNAASSSPRQCRCDASRSASSPGAIG
jgi:hypothetical protein